MSVVDPTRRRLCLEALCAGYSIRQAARRSGVCHGTLWYWFKILESCAEDMTTEIPAPIPTGVAVVRALHRAGMTPQEMSDYLDGWTHAGYEMAAEARRAR